MLLIALLACADKSQPDPAPKDPMWPFPSAHLVQDGRLALPEGGVPAGDTPFPVDRLSWRSGFSVVQTALIDPGVALDPDTLPGLDEVGAPGSVQLWDLDGGAPLRCFAELDAYPDQDAPTLIVRPLEPMPDGHRIAVVVTQQVTDTDGQPMPSPAWFDALLRGDPVEGLDASWGDHYQDLVAELEDLGVADIALAFDFPVADASAPLRAVVDAVGVPPAWEFRDVDDADTDDEVPDGAWIQLSGSFTTDSWLADDLAFVADDQGLPAPQGTAEADLFVHIPESARGAAPGTVPVWQFGHGIFSSPEDYLAQPDDPSGVVDLADRAGAILIATTWRGLTSSDLSVPVFVGADPGRFPELTDKLAQGVANNVALSRLILEGGLLDDPALMGLADPGDLKYYGISLGGIEGSVLVALSQHISHAVAHVPGSTWSTMLERSSNWTSFEPLVMDSLDEPADRQLLYAATQLLWDPVDPASYAADLQGRSLLLQESIGDEQVPNMTTESMARGMGAVLLEPAVYAVEGLSAGAAPLAGPALSQFDPQTALPPESNRPAPVTGAHGDPRVWEGAKLQTMRFLDPLDPGVVEHYCGADPCAADNDGSR